MTNDMAVEDEESDSEVYFEITKNNVLTGLCLYLSFLELNRFLYKTH